MKPRHTLDLVVLAAEWGHGRRRGWLSNLHLGARDPATGGLVMLGKTFKGLTDEMLTWQTKRLLELADPPGSGPAGDLKNAYGVLRVRPELVVEIAFDGVQGSPRYPGGVALRFARVLRHRPDKPAAEADTIDSVLALWSGDSPAPSGPAHAVRRRLRRARCHSGSRHQGLRRRGGIRAVRAAGQARQQQPGEEPGVVEHVKAGQVAGRVPAERVRRAGQARSAPRAGCRRPGPHTGDRRGRAPRRGDCPA